MLCRLASRERWIRAESDSGVQGYYCGLEGLGDVLVLGFSL